MTRAWHAHERSLTWLGSFEAEWLPEELTERVRVVVNRHGDVGVEVKGWVGSLGLANGDTLHLHSKFGDVDFLRMLFAVEGIEDKATGEAMYGAELGETPREYIVKQFATALTDVQARGLAFEWLNRSVTQASRPTKVHLHATTRRAILHRRNPFVGTMRERTTDTAEHRVLSCAAETLLSEKSTRSLPVKQQELFFRWHRRGWDPRSIRRDLAAVSAGLVSRGYEGSRGYYVPALRIALVVLGLQGISTRGEPQMHAKGFLVNSDLLFEEWVRKTIATAYNSAGYSVEKEKPHSARLFMDGTGVVEPDLLIRKGLTLLGLGDVKHKSPDSQDFYQMITYLTHYGLKRGFILSADTEQSDTITRTTVQGDLSVVVVPLPIQDLSLVEKTLSNLGKAVGF